MVTEPLETQAAKPEKLIVAMLASEEL